MEKIEVIIVDDHMLFSKALKSLIENLKNFSVLAMLSNGKEVMEYFSDSENKIPKIILMDVQMPYVNGIEATKWLTQNQPNIKVLALSMDADEEIILSMLRAGAKGYLLKDIHPSVLEKALLETSENGFYYTNNVAITLLKEQDINTDKIYLKEREQELLKYICTEMTYKQIAEKMFLSPKTIENYRESLFKKLNVKSRIGLVLYAIKEGIVTL